MISDSFVLKNDSASKDAALDKIEHIAAVYAFPLKDLLRIRLISEELISSVASALLAGDGYLWVSTTEKEFAVNVSCKTGFGGLSSDKRKQLLEMDKTTKRGGILGFLSGVVDFALNDDTVHTAGAYETTAMQGYMGMHGMGSYYINIPHEETGYWSIPKTSEKSDDLESSILEGFADDIRVRTRNGMLEMSAVKSFSVLASEMGIAIKN